MVENLTLVRLLWIVNKAWTLSTKKFVENLCLT